MIWPGMGDPAKRKKNIRLLVTTAEIAIGIGLASTAVQSQLAADDPLKQCINNHHTKYKISATLEVIIDGKKADMPAKVGFAQGCQQPLYTLSNHALGRARRLVFAYPKRAMATMAHGFAGHYLYL